jgi:type I restriction enzyme S subunit
VTVAKITPCFENGKGAVMRGLTLGVGFGTTELIVARPRTRETTSDYLHWLFISTPFRKLGEAAMYGAGGQKRVPDEFVRNFKIAFPAVAEQKVIATFLDHETAKIDALVAEQERLIALLKEKRQAVISRAVTKGLNPDAPMKDSGIEWLGKVPAHWEVLAVRRVITKIEQGWSPECESRPAEPNEWGVLKAGCVNRGVFSEVENKALPSHLLPIPDYEIHVGDLLMSRASGSPELVGSVAYIGATRSSLMLSDKIFRVQLTAEFDPRFFASVFNSANLRGQIEQAISGAEGLANNLPQSSMKCFRVAMPPLDEQRDIVAFLEQETRRIEALWASAETAIALLKERRSALISAAVTGKIDVRGFSAERKAAWPT